MPTKTTARLSSVLLILSAICVLVLGGTALAQEYVLKNPKHDRCRTNYIKKIETIKKREHGRVVKVRETLCVYVAPKKVPAVGPHSASVDPAPSAVSSPTPPASAPVEPAPKTSETEKEPVKETPPVKEPSKPVIIETITTLNLGTPECGEEIKERLIPDARVRWCKYEMSATTVNKNQGEPSAPKNTVYFIFPNEEGFHNYEFEAEIRRNYETTIKFDEGLGIKGEVISEACSIEIENSLYNIRDVDYCASLPMKAVYYGDEIFEKDKWLSSEDEAFIKSY